MRNDDDVADITFDISNNKVLANMDVNGAIKNLTIFRDTYRANEKSEGWAGVWLHKDFAEFGPYQFGITANGQAWNPDDFESKTGFIDNIIPITAVKGRGLSASYIACTPISGDGRERLRGTVYAVQLSSRIDGQG